MTDLSDYCDTHEKSHLRGTPCPECRPAAGGAYMKIMEAAARANRELRGTIADLRARLATAKAETEDLRRYANRVTESAERLKADGAREERALVVEWLLGDECAENCDDNYERAERIKAGSHITTPKEPTDGT